MEKNREPMEVIGPCGKTYKFRPEYENTRIQCPECRKIYTTPSRPNVEKMNALEKYLLKKGDGRLALAEATSEEQPYNKKYHMKQYDWTASETYLFFEDGESTPICFTDRPGYLYNAMVFGTLLFLNISLLLMTPYIFNSAKTLDAILIGLLTLQALLIAFRFKFYKRDLFAWNNLERGLLLFKVKDENKIEFPKATFSVFDENDQYIGKCVRSWTSSLVRTRWTVFNNNNEAVLECVEDSAVLALLRRFFFNKLFWFRVNFLLREPNDHKSVGEFKRSWSLDDNYLLDLSMNHLPIDTRLFFTLASLLDSAERR